MSNNGIDAYLNENYDSLCEQFCYAYKEEYEQYCNGKNNDHETRAEFCLNEQHKNFIDYAMSKYKEQKT